ncbi:MAG: reverse transcriptase/maturase family protein [bacterium]|nr:reverse transcriptase/maturase family protein [bacterium]
MKIHNNFYAEMISLENLFLAWDKFKQGKRKKLDVQIFELKLSDNLFDLYDDLTRKLYMHGPYESFFIADPKLRHIHKATVRDRVIHHAVYKYLIKIFEPTFIFSSYSCREEKGTHRGVDKLKLFAGKVYQTHGKCFVLKCDVRKFFDSINHKILIEIIERTIKDKDAMWLINGIVNSFKSEFSDKDDAKGAPIGNLTSQIFANIYMNEFDQFVKNTLKMKHYIRYTDDFLIVHHDVAVLEKAKDTINEFLRTKLKLSLHPGKVEIRKYKQGTDFLGYVTLPKARIVRPRTKKRMDRKINDNLQLLKNGKMEEKSFFQSFNSFLGVLSHANTYELKNKLVHKVWEVLNNQ